MDILERQEPLLGKPHTLSIVARIIVCIDGKTAIRHDADESPAGANRAGLLLDPFDEGNRQRPLFIDDDDGFERAAFCAHVGGDALAPPLR